MSICLVYDCLYPYTVGGAERWYRNLAERLVRDGHEVIYLTLRQWDRGAVPDVPGVRVVAVGPRLSLYGPKGTRRIGPPLAFGAGVLWHLLRHGQSYAVVHTASFPFFSLLAASLARRVGRYRLVVDWFEVWSRDYWREYLGAAGGLVGWLVQRACVRARQRAFCFSRLHAARLVEEGIQEPPTVLEGIHAGPLEPARGRASDGRPASPVVVFAGRHIPEKRVPAIVPAIAAASVPDLRCEIFGDGPDRGQVERLVAEHRLQGRVTLRGFASADQVEHSLAGALCMVLPSRREGYGLIVVEAAAQGTPSVVVAGADNAATELVEDGVNGVIVASVQPLVLASAIERIHAEGPALRRRTAEWFERNSRRLSLEGSLARVAASYGREAGTPSDRSSIASL